MLTFLTGGARSGKSSLAVALAERDGGPVVFLATARTSDDEEWTERVARHRAERPAAWTTVEEQVDLAAALSRIPDAAFVIVDCLTLWLANLLETGADEERVVAATGGAIDAAAARSGATVVVSNEVGSSIVPMDAGARRFRDLLGRVNATWAERADAAYLVVAGRVLALDRLHA